MPVLYGDFELRPGPRVSFDFTPRLAGDGRKLATPVTATLTGTIVPEKIDGVEEAVPVDGRLSTILEQMERLREAFKVDGRDFVVKGWDDEAMVSFPVRTSQVRFLDGDWVSRCDYEIQLEGPSIPAEDEGLFFIESCGESWQFEEDEQTWLTKVTHSVEAKGLTKYDGDGGIDTLAWENARSFALNQLKLGWTTVGGAYWSPASGQTILSGSAIVASATAAWNVVRQEQVDEIDGSYRCTESFVLSTGAYWEEYRLSSRVGDAEPNAIVSVSVTGTVHGLFADEGDFGAKYTNAEAGWDDVKDLVATRAQTAAGAATLSAHPVSVQVDRSPRDGTISYQYEYNDRPLVDDTWETYTVTPRVSVDDYRTNVNVQGTITGVVLADSDSDPTARLARALARWGDVKGLLLARAATGSGLADLRAFPVSAQYTPNPADGTVNYSYEFDNRVPEDVEDLYTVGSQYSRETGQTVVTIEGTIKGKRVANASDPYQAANVAELYDLASAYWDGKEPNLLSVASLYIATEDVNPTPWAKSVSKTPLSGQVGYRYEFSSTKGPCTPGALSESRTVVDTLAVPVFASIPVPGKSEGPVTQDMATITAGTREVTAEVVFPIADPCAADPPAEVDLTPMAPTAPVVRITTNQRSWVPTSGRLTRTMAWYYTQ